MIEIKKATLQVGGIYGLDFVHDQYVCTARAGTCQTVNSRGSLDSCVDAGSIQGGNSVKRARTYRPVGLLHLGLEYILSHVGRSKNKGIHIQRSTIRCHFGEYRKEDGCSHAMRHQFKLDVGLQAAKL